MYVFSFLKSCGLAVSNRFDRFDFCCRIRALYHLTPRIKLPAVHVHIVEDFIKFPSLKCGLVLLSMA